VNDRKRLSVLLTEETPIARTRSGQIYHFEKHVTATLGKKLLAELHFWLKLPILETVSTTLIL
jgi:uncharacterized protein (UPF0216 family)